MNEAKFTKDGKTIKASAMNDAGMGFLAKLVASGWYTEEEAFDLCLEYNYQYVIVREMA